MLDRVQADGFLESIDAEFGGLDHGFLLSSYQVGDHHGGDDTQDGNHEQDFQQRETAAIAALASFDDSAWSCPFLDSPLVSRVKLGRTVTDRYRAPEL